MITEKDKKEIKEWLNDSEDTTEYCNRSLTVDAFLLLDKNPPDVEGAKKRIAEILPLDSIQYRLVRRPQFLDEWNMGED